MHLKNLHPRLYTFNLDSGDEIRADSADSPVCFIIAEEPRETDFIRERAALLLRAGCRRFRFYGDRMASWYSAVLEMDAEMDPELRPEFRVQARAFAADTGFAADLRAELGKDGTKDVFLLYDNLQEAADFLFRALIGEPAGTWPDGMLPEEAADRSRPE